MVIKKAFYFPDAKKINQRWLKTPKKIKNSIDPNTKSILSIFYRKRTLENTQRIQAFNNNHIHHLGLVLSENLER